MKRLAPALLALCGCATTRILPLPAAAPPAPQPLPVNYEKTKYLLFTSHENDGLLRRFESGGPVVLAELVRPQNGVFASSDEGGSWTFAQMDEPPRQVLFDPADPQKIYARAGMHILYSSDGGHTWNASQPFAVPVDALAMGKGGAVLAGGRGSLAFSEDGARTWRALPFDPRWRVRSIAEGAGALFVSVHVPEEEPHDLLHRFVSLLDYSSDEAVSALALADARDEKPRPIAWDGSRGDGVYVSFDGGGLWKKTGLALDAYVTVHDGVLYAVAASPILQAAALVRRYPDLAELALRQMQADRPDAASLRAACRFPGRDKLLEGPIAAALVFRSGDGGATWGRIVDPELPLALALRQAVESAVWDPSAFAAPQHARPPQQQHQRGPQRGSQYRGMENPQRTGIPSTLRGGGVSPEALLSFVDPQRLLAHFNGGAPLAGISGDIAYAATESRWNALADALASQSEAEGEISLGPGAPHDSGVEYELLRWSGGWQPLASDLPVKSGAFPLSLAATPQQIFALLVTRDAKGQRWRAAFRATRQGVTR